jgi:hypothetical protein
MPMSWIKTIPDAEADEELRRVYESVRLLIHARFRGRGTSLQQESIFPLMLHFGLPFAA